VQRKLVGFTLPGRSAPRAGYTLSHGGEAVGAVTSGSYSPTLDTSIGMGYVLGRYVESGTALDLDIRGRTVPVTVTELPFYTRPRRPSLDLDIRGRTVPVTVTELPFYTRPRRP